MCLSVAKWFLGLTSRLVWFSNSVLSSSTSMSWMTMASVPVLFSHLILSLATSLLRMTFMIPQRIAMVTPTAVSPNSSTRLTGLRRATVTLICVYSTMREVAIPSASADGTKTLVYLNSTTFHQKLTNKSVTQLKLWNTPIPLTWSLSCASNGLMVFLPRHVLSRWDNKVWETNGLTSASSPRLLWFSASPTFPC